MPVVEFIAEKKGFFIVSLALFNDFQMMLRKYVGMHLASQKKSQFALRLPVLVSCAIFFQGLQKN